MAGTAITSLPSTSVTSGLDVGSSSTLTPSVVNEFRIAAVADRLAVHVLASHKMEMNEFFNLCLSLARGIDYAVANNEVPGRVQDLPRLLKQVCQQNADALLQAAIMVLMISVKNACRSGWFPTKDSTELLTLADEIGSNFCTVREMNTELSNSLDVISTIMARFYPRMKLGQILAFLEVKPGYGTFVVDFHISKISKPSAEEKIRLFVAQTDNVETSSCIITPPQVNFLLNGKGVDKRTTVIMDTGPQVPTVVTQMLKFGTNLLQAVGQFNGSYVIVVAYMNVISNPDPPVLQDYVHQTVAPLDSDSDIIEGASRVTLNCPISFRRITTPVKGHSCNHFQCFDFDNFVDMNSRRPAWRCPHCNQSVCFVDLRVDQNMVKVLKEVEENAVDVIISVDGSWKPVVETNDKTDQPLDESLNQQQEGPAQQEGPTQQEGPAQKESDIPSDVMDLTVEDDVMDIDELMYDTPDLKPNGANLQSQSTIGDLIFTSGMSSTSENQNASPHLEDDSWSGILLSTFATEASSTDGISGTGPADNFMPSPVLTDPVSPTLNQEPETFRESALIPTSTPPSQNSASTHLPLQQSHHGTSMPVNEYGSIQYIAGQQHVNRTQTAVQALPAPAHTQTSLPQQRSSFNPPQALPSQTHAMPPVATDRQHQYSRVQMNPPQRPQMSSPSPSPSPLPPYQAPQNWYPQHSFLNQVAPQIGTYSASYSPTSGHPYFRPNQNLDRRHSPSLPQPYSNFARNHIPQGMVSAQQSGQVTRQPPSVPVSLQTTRQSSVPVSLQTTRQSSVPASLQITRQSSVPVSLQSTRPPSPLPFPMNPNRFGTSVRDQRISPGGTPQSAPGTDSQADYPGEQNWRPAGRMRGSLSGRAYNEARDQIILPVPPNQAAPRPALNMTMPLPGMSTTLHALMVHNRNLGLASQPVNLSPPTESTSVASSSAGVLPEVSSGMQGIQ